MKKLTAAQRTLVHPLIDDRETAVPEPYVKPGPRLRRAVGGWPYAIHFFTSGGSLCGVREDHGPDVPTLGQCGTCQACRVEASKLRAVVR